MDGVQKEVPLLAWSKLNSGRCCLGGGGLLSPLEIGEESAMAVLERLARVLCT